MNFSQILQPLAALQSAMSRVNISSVEMPDLCVVIAYLFVCFWHLHR